MLLTGRAPVAAPGRVLCSCTALDSGLERPESSGIRRVVSGPVGCGVSEARALSKLPMNVILTWSACCAAVRKGAVLASRGKPAMLRLCSKCKLEKTRLEYASYEWPKDRKKRTCKACKPTSAPAAGEDATAGAGAAGGLPAATGAPAAADVTSAATLRTDAAVSTPFRANMVSPSAGLNALHSGPGALLGASSLVPGGYPASAVAPPGDGAFPSGTPVLSAGQRDLQSVRVLSAGVFDDVEGSPVPGALGTQLPPVSLPVRGLQLGQLPSEAQTPNAPRHGHNRQ